MISDNSINNEIEMIMIILMIMMIKLIVMM